MPLAEKKSQVEVRVGTAKITFLLATPSRCESLLTNKLTNKQTEQQEKKPRKPLPKAEEVVCKN